MITLKHPKSGNSNVVMADCTELTGARIIDSPVGPLRLVSDLEGIREVVFLDCDDTAESSPTDPRIEVLLDSIEWELSHYFSRKLQTFRTRLAPHGTDFDLRAWQYLRTIPFGQTRSYAEQARALGNANASRAVGGANGRNPLAIVVPCHRVIGANGSLTGFGGGIEKKKWLLEFEGSMLA